MSDAQNSKNQPKRIYGRPFPPGVSGNPGGRPKRKILSEAYKAILEKEMPDGRTGAEVVAEMILKEAKKGKVHAAMELADRTEGKPRQAYEVKLSIIDELPNLIEEGRKRVAARKKSTAQ